MSSSYKFENIERIKQLTTEMSDNQNVSPFLSEQITEIQCCIEKIIISLDKPRINKQTIKEDLELMVDKLNLIK
jgi:hypothetical protein